ncbi:MAG: ABC transporter ATP-binding protein [Ruminococcaceae bacterium]|jgi:peptide/nickel transport system ATP-binding protein|nr:ABC transporter ATP-binding protein [Oscillospiraceae bacterium]
MSEKKYSVEIKDLCVEFKTDAGVVKALNDMELEIEEGKTLGLVGETGAGKTTTGLSILRLIPSPPGVITKGTIKLNGQNIFEISEAEMQKLRGKAVSMIFQDPMTSLNPVITVEEQIAEVIELHEDVNHAGAIQRAKEMLELVGIPGERGPEYPHQFSGGMKQRVVIAIALACSPALLIADEPTTALDVTIQAQVLEMMKGLKEKYKTSMMMITHDLGIVAEICDDVSVVYGGHVIEHGSLEDVFNYTRHPYTEGLFRSLPDLDNRTAKLRPIKGLMPDPTNLPEGCVFYPRCDYAMEICKTVKPKRVYRNETHYVECHLYDEQSVKDGGKIGK